jgi:membrane protease YdiL (CAAX protease family)
MSQTLQTESQDLNGAYGSSARVVLRRIFVGSQGLRIVWSVLLFVAIYQVLHMAFSAVLSHFFAEPTGAIPVTPALLQESLELLAAFLATWIMARIENRGVLSYGYTGNHRLARMVCGMIWGFLCLSVLVGILWRMGWLVFDRPSLTGFAAWKYALAWGLLFLIVGVFEESLLRGYLQYTLSRGIGFWWAALLLSVVFALWHMSNNGESTLGLLEVGLSGLYFCLTLWYTKSLWWAIGFHAGWDWGQSYFYGTPDSGLVMQGHLLSSHPAGNPLWSGGTAGPEGSLLITPLVIVMAAGMWVWWGRIKKSRLKEPS